MSECHIVGNHMPWPNYNIFQVYNTSLSFFINGTGPGYSATHTVTLVSQIQDQGDAWLRVGLTLSGRYLLLEL